MAICFDKSDEYKISLGVVKSLEKRIGIVDVKLEQHPPTDKNSILQWEQKTACILPTDLKNFYLMNNGMKLTWSVKINENKLPVGKMEINAVECLKKIGGIESSGDAPNLGDIDFEYTDKDKNCPQFDSRSRIFVLDACDEYGKSCLVYNNTKPGIPVQHSEIWFLDRALRWHFLTETFLNYYCLMMTYIGLPQWQYSFTDIGLSPSVKQWFYMYAPMKLSAIMQEVESEVTDATKNALDAAKVFKGKSDKKKQPQAGTRRKTGSTNPGRNSATLNRQAVKKS